jgi:hypothetical protein
MDKTSDHPKPVAFSAALSNILGQDVGSKQEVVLAKRSSARVKADENPVKKPKKIETLEPTSVVNEYSNEVYERQMKKLASRGGLLRFRFILPMLNSLYLPQSA